MAKEKRIIIYYGNDHDFISQLSLFCNRYHKEIIHQLECQTYSAQAITDYLLKNEKMHLIFVDFLFLTPDLMNEFLSELNYLKKNDDYKSIVVAALFPDKQTLTKQEFFLSSGISLAYIQGCHINDFILNSFEIAFDDTLFQPNYAKADRIDLEIEICFCSTLIRMDDRTFTIESDYEVQGKEIKTRLPMFKELTARTFKINKSYDFSTRAPHYYTYHINLPITGAWDRVTTDELQKATVETWLGLKQDIFEKENTFVKVFTKNTTMIPALVKLQSKIPVTFDISTQWSSTAYTNEKLLKRPRLVFFDLKDMEMDALSELTDIILNQREYRPILIVAHSPSKSEALRKLYHYPQLMALSEQLSIETIQVFTQKYIEAGKGQSSTPPTLIKMNQRYRVIDIHDNFIFTSLTEREFTFLSKVELPYYTVVKINLSFIIYGILVPYELSSFKKKDYYHYKALIHGVEEGEIEKLRKLVNQIIFNSVENLNPDTIEELIAQNVTTEIPVVEKPAMPAPKKKEDFSLAVKQIKKGVKSKL